MDIALFVATAAATVYHLRRSRNSGDLPARLRDCTSRDAHERICLVTPENVPIAGGGERASMRLHNQWHRATYVLVLHEAEHLEQHGSHPSDVYVLVQRRSQLKDYCPGKLDPLPGGVVGYEESYYNNAVREIGEEMGIIDSKLERLFTFPYEDERVRVWGDFYVCTYRGAMRELILQKEEVNEVLRMSLEELQLRIEREPGSFMPDACHAMMLYFQRVLDTKVNRRLLKGYSSSNLDAYHLRPKPEVIFFDCDDCLYFDNWKTASLLTKKINEWCTAHGLESGYAYELYKQYGTALRGLLAEGHLNDSEEAIDEYLRYVHDIPIHDLIGKDKALREMILSLDPSIPRYIFTASVRDHALRCITALGIEDLFVDIIDCKRCGLETKHSHHSFKVAMGVAGVSNPEACLFVDDSTKNIHAAREIGWRSILVGKIGRDHGNVVSSEHAEFEVDRIHDLPSAFPEIFVR